MFRTTAEAKGERLDRVKHVEALPPVIYCWPFQGGTSV